MTFIRGSRGPPTQAHRPHHGAGPLTPSGMATLPEDVDRHNGDMEREDRPQETLFVVGEPFPLACPPHEGTVMSLMGGGTFHFLFHLARILPEEVAAFRASWHFAIYEGPDMPGGLILVGLKAPEDEDFWIQEFPFDAAKEAQVRLESTVARISGQNRRGTLVPVLHGFLVDSRTTILRAIKQIGPPTAWVERLEALWAAQPGTCPAGAYDRHYEALTARKPTEQLWAEATKYPLPPS